MSKTSSTVKNKYNARVYRQVSVMLSRELVDRWESEISADGISKAAFFRSAMLAYLKEKGVAFPPKAGE